MHRKPRIYRFSMDNTWFTKTLVHFYSYVGYMRLFLGSASFQSESRRAAFFFHSLYHVLAAFLPSLFFRVWNNRDCSIFGDKDVSEVYWLPSLGSETTLVVVTSSWLQPNKNKSTSHNLLPFFSPPHTKTAWRISFSADRISVSPASQISRRFQFLAVHLHVLAL
jgi:hypothetical protein